MVYGRDPPFGDYEPGKGRTTAADTELRDRDLFLADVQGRLLHALEYAKHFYDEKHREVHFQEGDWVWLRLHRRATPSLPGAAKGKLGPRYHGPYCIISKINEVAYKLALPASPPICILCQFQEI